MFDTICTLPLSSDLFAQVLHPTAPLLTVGLASGYVYAYKLPPADDDDPNSNDDDDDDFDNVKPPSHSSRRINGTTHITPIISTLRRSSSASENGLGSIDTAWKTHRHKGSCRCLTYSHDGEMCYSAGTDGLVKVFLSETGKVISKIAMPTAGVGAGVDGDIDGPTALSVLSPQALLLGTDSGKLLLYDLRQNGKEATAQPAQTWTPHGREHISSIAPLPPSQASTSGFPKTWVSVGGSTLAVTDLRKGLITTSEDQETELLSVSILTGLKKGGTSVGEKVLVGQADGVVSLWEKGVWDDLDDRIVIDRQGGAVEDIVEVPSQFGTGQLKMNEKVVAVGLDDGRVRFVRIGRNGVIAEWDVKHDEMEGVVGLGFDVDGRMVSGGGQTIKIWTEAKGLPGGGKNAMFKHELDSDDASDQGSEDNSEDDGRGQSKRKKRKRNKGKDKTGGQAIHFAGL